MRAMASVWAPRLWVRAMAMASRSCSRVSMRWLRAFISLLHRSGGEPGAEGLHVVFRGAELGLEGVALAFDVVEAGCVA